MIQPRPTAQALLACAVPFAVTLVPHVASAQSAIECSSTSWTPEDYTLRIGVDGASTYPLDPVIGGLGYRRYDNMLKHTRKFIANKFVNAASFNFATIDTEPGYDRFTISGAPCSGGNCTPIYTLSGALAAGNRDLTYAGNGQSLTSAPLRLQFVSDASITKKGVDISSASVRCFGGGISNDLVETLSPGDTVDGVLLGANDIVYMGLPGGATPGFHQTVALWASDPTTDLDLLLACGRRPTMADYDVASRTGGNNEFIEFSDATRVCTGTWFLGVHSYAGSGKDGKGAFHLLYSRHKAAQHIRLKAGFTTKSCTGGLVTDFAQRADAHPYLASASQAIFGATDGQVFVDWDLYNAGSANDDDPLGGTWSCGGSACNLRLDECHGGGQSFPLADVFWIGNQWHNLDGGSIIHEFGHAHLGLGAASLWPFGEDGYWFPLSDPRTILPSGFPTGQRNFIYNVCGHSAMSNGYLGSTAHKYCTSYDHMRNQRYVAMGWETNVLTTNGQLDLGSGGSGTQYSEPIGVTGYGSDWTPAPHSLLWSGVSDWAIGIHNGVLWYEPDGSDDPYEFLDYPGASVPGFPGKVTDW
jgi:hypothetical protein